VADPEVWWKLQIGLARLRRIFGSEIAGHSQRTGPLRRAEGAIIFSRRILHFEGESMSRR
jgi:hypothetical protein